MTTPKQNDNFSLLIVRPEAFLKAKKIKASLQRRKYLILGEKKYDNWKDIVSQIYKTTFNPQMMDYYLQMYDQYCFGNNFLCYIVSIEGGDTLRKLRKELGNFKSYQTKKEDTLRAEFGLPSDYNGNLGNMIFTFPGLHCPKNKKELRDHLRFFQISFEEGKPCF